MDKHCVLQTKKESIDAYIKKNDGLVVIYGTTFWGGCLAETIGCEIDYFCDRKALEMPLFCDIPVVDVETLADRVNENGRRATVIVCVPNKSVVTSIYWDLMKVDLNADVFDYFDNEIVFSDKEFVFDSKKYMLFEHPFNCGYTCARMTERCVELALAKEYVNNCNGNIVEIGAVTPYYFYDEKIAQIIDPYDTHKRVTKGSIFKCDLQGKNVLSISTVEHIGKADYGLQETENAIDAVEKILNEAATCLVTAPLGYNDVFDGWVEKNQKNPAVKLLRRGINNHWDEITGKYTPIEYTRLWANGLVIIEK